MLVDTHCHIFSEYYDNIEEVIGRAIDNGVKMIIVNGCDSSSNREVIELANKYDIVYGALGIQPEYAVLCAEEDFTFIEEHINDKKIIAVGEIGLDYHYDIDKYSQINVFKRQLDIAFKYNKPVIVHSRDSIQDTYNILKESSVKGIMHCYSGSVEMAHLFTEIGFYLGIGGIATFKNAVKLTKVIKEIGLEYIVLETDSPYLTPEPYRGKRNEPSYVGLVLDKVAEIKDLDKEYVEKKIYENVLKLFDK